MEPMALGGFARILVAKEVSLCYENSYTQYKEALIVL